MLISIILTDDSFKKFFLGFTINFSSNKPVTNFFEKKYEPSLQKLHKKNFGNIIELKVRKEAFLEVIDDKLPWEDLLIGPIKKDGI